MTPESEDANVHRMARLRERAERERRARVAAEELLEIKSLELFSINEQLETRVKERTRQLEATLANIAQGVLMRDNDGAIIFHNDQVLSLLDLPLSAGACEILSEIDAIDTVGEPARVERRLDRRHRKDIARSGDRYLELVRNVLPDGGEVLTFSDISNLKRRQKELEEASKTANEANKAKTRFLSTLSHEIRTPLNGVLGCLELLKDMQLNQEQARLADMAASSGEGLLQLVNDVLDLSRIDGKQDTLETRPVDILSVAQASCRIVKPLADKKNIELLLEAPTAEIANVISDGRRLQQVLVNLLGNAIKFSSTGPVRLRVLPSDCVDGRLAIRVEVIDKGIGISREDCSKIFDSFWQVGSDGSQGGLGWGLGLAICKRMIEQIGGTIGVESQFGLGSTFYLDLALPLATEVTRQSEVKVIQVANNEPRVRLASARVLLAEDNDTNALVATEYLKVAGCTITRAKTGREAVIKASQTDYDLVLMDISMPELDGLGAARILRWHGARNSRTAIVALTANATTADQQKLLSEGFQDFVTKPVKRETLVSAAYRHAGQQLSLPVNKFLDDSRLFDLEVADLMRNNVSESVWAAVLSQFLAELDVVRDRLHILKDTRDAKALKQVAHALSGASATIGALQLAQDSHDAEWMMQMGASDLDAVINRLLITTQSTADAIRALGEPHSTCRAAASAFTGQFPA